MNGLAKLRDAYPNNPIIGYININSLREKIISLRDVISKSKLEVLCIYETKLDLSFPDTQFKIEGCQFPLFREDRNSDGGGKIIYVREGLVTSYLFLKVQL